MRNVFFRLRPGLQRADRKPLQTKTTTRAGDPPHSSAHNAHKTPTWESQQHESSMCHTPNNQQDGCTVASWSRLSDSGGQNEEHTRLRNRSVCVLCPYFQVLVSPALCSAELPVPDWFHLPCPWLVPPALVSLELWSGDIFYLIIYRSWKNDDLTGYPGWLLNIHWLRFELKCPLFGERENPEGESVRISAAQSETEPPLDHVDVQLEHRGHSTAFVDWNRMRFKMVCTPFLRGNPAECNSEHQSAWRDCAGFKVTVGAPASKQK